MSKVNRGVSSLLSIVTVLTMMTACCSSSVTNTVASSHNNEEATVFSHSIGETPYFGCTVFDTVTETSLSGHQVCCGVATDTEVWILTLDWDNLKNYSNYSMEKFSFQGELLESYPVPCSLNGTIDSSVFIQDDSLVITAKDFLSLTVYKFDMTTHDVSVMLNIPSSDGAQFCDVFALKDNAIYVSTWEDEGYSFRGYNLSDGSLKVKPEGVVSTEGGFFWCDNRMYALGIETGRFEYELLYLNEDNKYEQCGLIQLPAYASKMRNIDSQQYMNSSEGLWRLDSVTGTWQEMVHWDNTDLHLVFPDGYSVSKDGTSLVVWEKDTQYAGFLYPDSNPSEGKTTFTVVGNWITQNEKYQWAVSKFNKTNEKYAVKLLDYEDILDPNEYLDSEGNVDYDAYWKAFNDYIWKESVNGEGPDLFIKDNTWKYFEYGGLFVDLKTKYDGMGEEWKSQYFTNVIETMMNQEHLYAIPIEYNLNVAELMTECDISMDATFVEWEAYMNRQAEGRVLFNDVGIDLLNDVLKYDMSSFVDGSTGKTSFDSQEFRSLLHLAKDYCVTQQEYDNCIYRDSVLNRTYYNPEEVHLAVSTQRADKRYGCLSATGPSLVLCPQLAYVSSSCDDVDGAWEFICFLLSEEIQEYDLKNAKSYLGDYPVRRDALEYMLDFLKHPEEHENFWRERNAEDPDWKIDDEVPLTDEESRKFVELVESLHLVEYPDTEIIDIIMEETGPYFAGQKSEEEVISIITNRVRIILEERET
ncbi:MAG: hypothetical protein KBT07_06410 [Clostridiales bacterium]|nr:hypothetical protein [Candidatus Scatonaster coprocaballi]